MVGASQAGVQRAASPLPGFGVSPQNLFLLFSSPPAAAREKKEVPGDTPDPGRENPAPLQGIHQFREDYLSMVSRKKFPIFLFTPSNHLTKRNFSNAKKTQHHSY